MTATSSRTVIGAPDARRELARRELARRHVIDFAEYINPQYRAAAVHRLIGEYLEQVETYIRTEGRTGVGRLLVLAPPRHGKSELVSRQFPAWMLGRLPDKSVILTSYGADLATKHSRAARDIVLSARYRAVFGTLASVDQPVTISEDSRSVVSWNLATPHRGGMTAAGVGGAITGLGAHLFVVDDPLKNREEAESEARRENVWEWWTSTAYSRLEKGAAVVGMLTRWHADDWAGRLIKAMATDPKADRWVVLALPAIWEPPEAPEGKTWDAYQSERMLEGIWVEREDALGREPGDALWPEMFDEAELERRRVNSGPYDWSALYQQDPYLRSGAFFKREWFTIVDRVDPDEIVMRVRFYDKAGNKRGSGGDYAASALMARLKSNQVVVEHADRGQFTPGKREEWIVRTAKTDATRKGPRTIIWHQQDPGSAGLDSAQATNRRLAMEKFTAHFETVSGDKEVRAGPWSSALEGGQVWLMRGAWNDAYIDEHVAFPKGRHDDWVDCSSSAYNKLTGKKARREARSYQG